jgi:hydroxypyruvate reductase
MDALAALGRARVPRAIRAHLEAGAAGAHPETVKPGDALLAGARFGVVGSLGQAVEAARRAAEQRGLHVRDLGRALDGEVRAVALRLAEAARQARAQGIDVVLAGGEPRVVVRGPGQGGRAQELALELALALEGEPGIAALLAATDGSDGNTAASGAFVDGELPGRARARGIDVRAALARSDSHTVHAALGSLFVSGPTRTNVADLALLRVRAGPGRVG